MISGTILRNYETKDSLEDSLEVFINPSKKIKTSLKLGFNHCYSEEEKPFIEDLKPKVLRIAPEITLIKKCFDIGAEPFINFSKIPKTILDRGMSSNRFNKELSEYVSDIFCDISKKYPIKYVCLGNEPDRTKPPFFWEGTIEDYLNFFYVSFKAIKKINPFLKIGGPETYKFNKEFMKRLINFCKNRGNLLDFISFHQFEDPPQLNKNIVWLRDFMRDNPVVHIGEWGFKIMDTATNLIHIKEAEKSDINYYCKDYLRDKDWKYKSGLVSGGHLNKRGLYYVFKKYLEFNNRIFVSDYKRKDVAIFFSQSNEKDLEGLVAIRPNSNLKKLKMIFPKPENTNIYRLSIEEKFRFFERVRYKRFIELSIKAGDVIFIERK